MKRLLSKAYLHLIAGAIALGILTVSIHILWADRLATWQEAEKSSENLLTALARDLGGNIGLLDLSIRGVIQDLGEADLQHLAPELRHRMLFDRAASASLMGSILVLNEKGDVVADAASIVPRSANFSDRDYFTAHQHNPRRGLYVSRPYRSRFRNNDLSIAISRRLSHADGSFAGVVMGAISLTKVDGLFQDLKLGWAGTINLFRQDGLLLMRKPYDEKEIGQDFGTSVHVQRLLQGGSGTFDSVSPIDGIHRVISFGRIGHYPLVLTVALSVEEVFAAWNRKVLVLSFITAVLCAAVVGLTVLFRSELNRRTRAETKLRRLARTDDLTGLPNRRAFRETLEREWRQATRSGFPLALLFIDADYFKNFNDQYGHGLGDEVLRAIASTLDAAIRRPHDIAARYGGEEFAVILPETDLAGAWVLAESIRQAVTGLDIAHAGSPYQVVTVSIGTASVQPSRHRARETLLEAADTALYQAKAAGRNSVRAYEMNEVAHHPGALPHSAA
ncbi:sensor domain-containing diguanylate cyclase [Microvirga roseola]|uniref:sensor domain-containing diguanylate cyclase n=1 Tax=Microvirga roseola TaxID=2883126 RepID=UPI001E5DB4D2|nr:sensor domain-containing diguanylate cyclase [Microvirga roseola]